MAYTVDDLARYLAGIVTKQKRQDAEAKKDKVQWGVVREGNTVEVAGTIYPAIFDCVDDIFQPGDGVKIAYMQDSDKVLVIGR
jgi:hypothetical protein